MPKIYSSINENFVRRIEEEVRPAFHNLVGDDWDKVKELLDDIKLFIKVEKLNLKLKSYFCDDEKLVRYQQQYEIYKPKWEVISEQYDREFIRHLFYLQWFIDEYGLKKLLKIEYFSEWLSTSKGDFDYYDCRS